MPHTDIKSDGWIEKNLPVILRPYAYLARLDRPIGIWLLLLPGWCAIALAANGITGIKLTDFYIMALFGIGAIVMRSAGCVINDLWDRNLDKEVERTKKRPLAAGTLSPKQAICFLLILLTIGFCVLMQMQLVTILLGFLTIPLIALYPLMKRISWWPQAFLGITFNFGALMGWAAITAVVGLPALLLYAGCLFWTTGYDTIYAHQDKEDDARVGIKSSALKLGSNSKKWVSTFYVISFAFIALAFLTAQAGILSYLLLLTVARHFYKQIENWDIDDNQSSLDVFKSNRNAGFLILLAAFL